jgi:hypothetical protein
MQLNKFMSKKCIHVAQSNEQKNDQETLQKINIT